MPPKWKKWCLRAVSVPFFIVLLYGGAALLLARVPVQRPLPADETAAAAYRVYLVSNGVHINLVLPARDSEADWPQWLPETAAAGTGEWLYLGWGSEAFYTQVPTWGDLTPSVAAKALLWDNSVLWARYGPPPHTAEPAYVRRLDVSAAQYRRLLADVRAQWASAQPLAGQPHFYPARGAYHPLQTCNEWVRRRLYHAGVRVPAWTPFDRPLLWFFAS